MQKNIAQIRVHKRRSINEIEREHHSKSTSRMLSTFNVKREKAFASLRCPDILDFTSFSTIARILHK